MTEKLTAQQIAEALRETRYRDSEWLWAREVPTKAGYGSPRTIDCVAMHRWSSHNHQLDMIELKVSRSDFQAELKDPAKHETFFRWANRFWIAAPQGLLKAAELPEQWGLLTVGLNDDGGWRVRQLKAAQTMESEMPSRSFFAMFARRAVSAASSETRRANSERHSEDLERLVAQKEQLIEKKRALDKIRLELVKAGLLISPDVEEGVQGVTPVANAIPWSLAEKTWWAEHWVEVFKMRIAIETGSVGRPDLALQTWLSAVEDEAQRRSEAAGAQKEAADRLVETIAAVRQK